jgi:hypothetical protein
MPNWSPIVSAFGISIILIGTVVLALPDLPRFIRVKYYENSLHLREYYEAREYVSSSQKGKKFNFDDYVVCYTFIDYMDKNHRDIPDEIPDEIETGAAQLRAKEANGWESYNFRRPQERIVELLDMAIERECRMSGIMIALIGTLIAITGSLM